MMRRIVPGVSDGKQALCCLPTDLAAHDAAQIMIERRVGAVMVVENGRLKGIVTGRDPVFRLLARDRDARSTSLAEIMTADPETLTSGDSALATLDKIRVGRYRHRPVVDDGDIAGTVSIRDLYEAARQTLEGELRSAESLIYGEQYGAAAS
jgi:CBS domain-containing protein